jgi:hypothetical protein
LMPRGIDLRFQDTRVLHKTLQRIRKGTDRRF